MNEGIQDLNSLQNIRKASNFLARVRLKGVDDYNVSLDAHHFLLEKTHAHILPMVNHMDMLDSFQRGENQKKLRGYISAANTIVASAKEKIAHLLSEDIEAGEEYLRKFVVLTGEIYIDYKTKLLHLCGETPIDSYNSTKPSIESPNILLESRKQAQQDSILLEHPENKRTDTHHIDKQSYLGTSQEPMLIELERAFHTLLHSITDDFDREDEIGIFENDPRPFREKLPELDKKLRIFNQEYCDVLMEDPQTMSVFENNPKDSEHFFEHYVESIQPHFREIRNAYALEMMERMIKVIPYYVRNFSEAKHYELTRYFKKDIYVLLKYLRTVKRQYRSYELRDEEIEAIKRIETLSRTILTQMEKFNVKKAFQIRKKSPMMRHFHSSVKKDTQIEYMKEIEKTLSILEENLISVDSKSDRARCLTQLQNMLHIIFSNTKNIMDSQTVGEEYVNQENRKKRHLALHQTKHHHGQHKPRQNRGKKRWGKRKRAL